MPSVPIPFHDTRLTADDGGPPMAVAYHAPEPRTDGTGNLRPEAACIRELYATGDDEVVFGEALADTAP
jgi:hypothetical protein